MGRVAERIRWVGGEGGVERAWHSIPPGMAFLHLSHRVVDACVSLCQDSYVEGVAAVFTGGCLSAVPTLIYFRKKRKRVGMKIEI